MGSKSKRKDPNERLNDVYRYNYQFSKEYDYYDPVMVGSIDGSDERPHDHGIIRAINTDHYKPNTAVKSDPDRTLFIGRLNFKTKEEDLVKIFSKYGKSPLIFIQ